MDDGAREIHGCYVKNENERDEMLTVSEFGDHVWINASHHARKLTPARARHIANALFLLADRIERRNEPAATTREPNPSKVAAGRARAANLSPERRSEIAKDAAIKRWSKTSTEQAK